MNPILTDGHVDVTLFNWVAEFHVIDRNVIGETSIEFCNVFCVRQRNESFIVRQNIFCI